MTCACAGRRNPVLEALPLAVSGIGGKVQRSVAAGRTAEEVGGGSRCLAAVESSVCLHV